MRGVALVLLLVIGLVSNGAFAKHRSSRPRVKRSDFPKDFIFGAATAAYQCEGAAHEDGRGPSIWDTFSEKHPEKIDDRSNGSVADNSYHLYKEDVGLLHKIGFGAYRFSISWSRVLPRGNLKGGINPAGIKYYNNLINELLSKGITPFVTIFHWDTPQALEDAYGGFRGSQIVNDYKDYAELLFKTYGDRVKHWITLNEPLTVTHDGYATGSKAPGRCSKFTNPKCLGGDGATEPYIVGHNLLLSHAAAVKVYREKYQAIQKGEIGIALSGAWNIPYSDSQADRLAAVRATTFNYDWFMEPLVSGRYPDDMVSHVKGGRLPTFTTQQSEMLKGSIDFVGINYYSTSYAKDVPCTTQNVTLLSDPCTSVTYERNGVPIGPKAASNWLYVYPKGLRELLLYMKYKFNDPIIYITENGYDELNTGKVSLNDEERIDYLAHHLKMAKEAIKIGANLKGFFVWSLLDNYEWRNGYTMRFGVVFVDYKDGQKRYPKESAKWFSGVLKGTKKQHAHDQQLWN